MGIARNVFAATLLAAAFSTTAFATDGDLRTGAVFVMTNQPTANQVIAYDRNADGSLVEVGRFSTGGRGDPFPQGSDPITTPLASQGSLVVDEDGRYILAVNAKSNSLSTLRIGRTGLTQVSVASTSGKRPISIAIFSNLVYVLNESSANDLATVKGFILGPFGRLRELPDGGRVVASDPAFDGGQAALDRDGRLLTITDKHFNEITTFKVFDTGVLSEAVVTPSSGATPCGVAYDGHGHVIVSEAQGGAQLAGSVSSYGIGSGGGLSAVSSSVADSQTSPCWVVATRDAKFVYTANTASGKVSSYSLGVGGGLTLLDSTASDTVSTSAVTDMALSRDGQFLYVIQAALQSIAIFRVQADGKLVRQPSKAGLPVGVQGIAAN